MFIKAFLKRRAVRNIIAIVAIFSLVAINDFSLSYKYGEAATSNTSESNRLIVSYKKGVESSSKDKVAKNYGLSKKMVFPELDMEVYEVESGKDVKKVKDKIAYENSGLVNFVEVDEKVSPAYTPNDPSLGSQWHLAKIGAQQAWDLGTGESIAVGIADTGVDLDHPDLVANLLPGWNFYDNNDDPSDVKGHGTAVAGTVAEVGDNALQGAGVAFGADIVPLRIAGADGYAYYSTMTSAMYYAVSHGIKIINFSYSGSDSLTIRSAAQYMYERGGLVVFSEGNTGTNPGYSDTPYIINVSATDKNDLKTSWSTYGVNVDVAAPGYYIYTTNNGGGFGAWSGTSFSAPIASAVLALIWQANPDLRNNEVENILFDTALDLGDPGRDIYYGWGRVDANAAITKALSTVGDIDRQDPVVSIIDPVNNATVAGDVNVIVNATDNVGVEKVTLYVDGVAKGTNYTSSTSLYSFVLDTFSLSEGNHSLTATAYDNSGNTATSESVKVVVDNLEDDVEVPMASIIEPIDGSVLAGNVNVVVDATDNVAVEKVSLYVDGVLNSTDTSNPYSFTLDTTRLSEGSHVLTAVAYDTSGNASSPSESVNITVKNVVEDFEAPTVDIVSHSDGDTVTGPIKIVAVASDNIAVDSLSCYWDNKLLSTISADTISCNINVTKEPTGLHTIKAVAYDAAGNTSFDEVEVIVKNRK